MQFEPKIHTKQALLADIPLLVELCKLSGEFASSDLANDYDLLKTVYGTASHTMAHILAKNRSEWLQSTACQDKEILKLTDLDGRTVAHDLAANKKTEFRAAIWSDEVLKLRSSSGAKIDIAVAHVLAETSKEWCNHAKEAFDKHILTMSYRDDIGSTKYISVAERVSLRFVPRQAVVMRLISTGAAFKVGSYGYKNQILGKDITEQTSDLIDGSADKLVQMKLASALYSTIVHFVTSIKSAKPEQWNSSYSAASQQENIDQWLMHESNAENLLRKLIDAEPSLLNDLNKDINCEPSFEFLCRYAALREFDDFAFTLNDNDFSDNPLNPKTLY